MVPAVATLGTKIVKEDVSVQPFEFVTTTVTVDCWVIEFVVKTLSVTSAKGAATPFIVKEYVYPGKGGPAVITTALPAQIVSPGASETIEAESRSLKKSTKIVISSIKVHPSATTLTFILSPLLNCAPPLPAVAETILEGPAAAIATSFLKN